jgi:hypothetical protein
VIVVDQEMDKMLTAICDAALKHSGMQSLQEINELAEAVVDEEYDHDREQREEL